VVLGAGERLVEDVGDPVLTPVEVIDSPHATHVRYRVGRATTARSDVPPSRRTCDARAVKLRELIELLDKAADELPDGLDSRVLVHLCNGREEAGVLTKEVGVATGDDDEGVAAHCVILEGHPHADDEDTVQRPTGTGVDADLERLTSGDPLPRAGVTVALGDTGEGFRIPYGEGGRPILPGSPKAVAAGCLCDPEKNDHGRGARPTDGDHVDMVPDDRCPIHRRVEIDPEDAAPDE
jgi:hypothetical protein